MVEGGAGPEVPAVVERFVKQLYIAAKAVRLHPAASNIPKERAAAVLAVLKAAQQRLPEVTLRFTHDALLYDGATVFPGRGAYVEFAREFYARGVDEVRFHVGTTAGELTDLLAVLVLTPEELGETGGFEARLRELDVANVTVHEIAVRIVDVRHSESASDLLDGPGSVDRLVASLAEESDPEAHRALLDAVADASRGHIDALSRWIDDPRRSLVRDVVAVLGRSRDPACLPALARATRYPDARVRREAVRGLEALRGPRAAAALVGALEDDDAGTVQLAARALGARRETTAVPALMLVAGGEGCGNRETGPRVEAIEALGRVAGSGVLVLLRSLTRRRGLRVLGMGRELAPAAERAMAAIMDRVGDAKRAPDPAEPDVSTTTTERSLE